MKYENELRHQEINYFKELIQIKKLEFKTKLDQLKNDQLRDIIDLKLIKIEFAIHEQVARSHEQVESIQKQAYLLLENVKNEIKKESVSINLKEFKLKIAKDGNIERKQSFYRNKLKKFECYLKKGQFKKSTFTLHITNIGYLKDPYLCDYAKLSSIKSFQIDSDNLTRIIHVKHLNKLLVCDIDDQCIKEIDLVENTFARMSLDNHLRAPYCLCLSNKQDLFVGDHFFNKIFKFNSKLKFLMSFGDHKLKAPYDLCVNNQRNSIYACDWRNNCVTSWHTKSGKFKNEFKINSPLKMNLIELKNCLCITSLNSIFLIDEITFTILNTIKYGQWTCLRGLCIDNQMNILVLARESKLYSESHCLFVFEQNGDLLTKVDLNGLYNDFVSIDVKTVVACKGLKKPSLVLFEFNNKSK